jgi:hypothetical protein
VQRVLAGALIITKDSRHLQSIRQAGGHQHCKLVERGTSDVGIKRLVSYAKSRGNLIPGLIE